MGVTVKGKLPSSYPFLTHFDAIPTPGLEAGWNNPATSQQVKFRDCKSQPNSAISSRLFHSTYCDKSPLDQLDTPTLFK